MRPRLTFKPFAIYLLAGMMFSIFASGKPVSADNEENAKKVIEKMMQSIDDLKTLRYNLQVAERINGKMLNTESFIKLQVSPRKIYMYLKGPEVLWIEGQNNGNALVNPGTFPYVNLNLSPYGSLMRKDQHHTINEIGFSYLRDVLGAMVSKAGDKFDKYFNYSGEDKVNNRPCHKILISYPEFTFVPYTVKKGENLVTIARKQKVSEYMILENNKHISDYYSVKEGQQVMIPNAYAKTVLLYIDKQHYLPVNIKIFDDKGLYESYEYKTLIVNPQIADEEVTKEYKDYRF
jgi:outer membrane lipoprotein-sorting protein